MIRRVPPHSALTAGCPTDAVLCEFLAGRAGTQHDQIEAHVLRCNRCSDRVGALAEPSDAFIGELRVAAATESEAGPASVDSFAIPPAFRGVCRGDGHTGQHALVLGDFRLIRQIGRGGMGIVYEAEQVSLARRVALKTLQFTRWVDEVSRERFQNEARAAALLEHPHIVPIYSVGEVDGMPYFTMKLIEGCDLGEIIRCLQLAERENTPVLSRRRQAVSMANSTSRAGQGSGDTSNAQAVIQNAVLGRSVSDVGPPLGLFVAQHGTRGPTYFRAVAELGAQAADALGFAHDRGVVHRDIKPSNLLIDARGGLWIADFGLAQIDSAPGLTAASVRVGTPRYMSPERALGSRGIVDHRCDIYSLGATLYELLALSPVFGDATGERLIACLAAEDPLPLRKRDGSIPRDLAVIVETAIARDPRDRYASAQAMAADLRRFLAGEPIAARRPGIADRCTRWLKRHPATTGAAAVALVASVTVASILAIYTGRLSTTIEKLDETVNSLGEEVYAGKISSAWEAADRNEPQVAHSLLEELRLPHEASVPLGIEWELVRQRCLGRRWHRSLLNSICAMALSPSGRYIAIADPSGVAQVLEADTLKLVAQVDKDPDFRMDTVAFAPDEVRVATAGAEPAIRIWNIGGDRVRETQAGVLTRLLPCPNPDHPIRYLQWTPDGSQVVAANGDVIRIWDVETGAVVAELTGHTDRIRDMALSPDGKWLASCAHDGSARLWNLHTRECAEIYRRPGEGPMIAVAVSPDGQLVATSSTLGYLQLWRPGKKPITIERIANQARHIRLLPDGDGLLTLNVAGVAEIWDFPWNRKPTAAAPQPKTLLTLQKHLRAKPRVSWEVHTAAPTGLLLDVPRGRIITSELNGVLGVSDLKFVESAARLTVPGMDDQRQFRFTPADELLAWHTDYPVDFEGAPDRTLWIYNIRNGTKETYPALTGLYVTAAQITPDGTTLIAAIQGQGVIALRREPSAQAVPLSLDLPANCYIRDLIFSRDGHMLFVRSGANEDSELLAVSWPAGQKVDHIPSRADISVSALSNSAQQLIFSSEEKRSLPAGSHATYLAGIPARLRDTASIGTIALAPNEKLLAIARKNDFRVTLVDLVRNVEVGDLIGHSAEVTQLRFSPDGLTLVSGDHTGCIKLWRVPSRRKLFDLLQAEKSIDHIEFSPSGRFLAVGATTAILLWDLERAELD